MKLYILSFFIFLSFSITPNQKKIILATIPKSGTHLIEKCINLIGKYTKKETIGIRFKDFKKFDFSSLENYHQKTQGQHKFYNNFWKKNPCQLIDFLEKKILKKNEIFYIRGHVVYEEKLATHLCKREYKVFLNVRDPRDQMVSCAKWLRKILPSSVRGLSLNEIITMQMNDKILKHQGHNPGVDGYLDYFIPWLDKPNVMLIKFENLVGPKGGGDRKLQLNEIKKIAYHIDISLTDWQTNSIAKELFGGTYTFIDGQQSAWKKSFSSENLSVFYQNPRCKEIFEILDYIL